MPIIAQKHNPPSQLQKRSILETEGTWWIAKVKPQQEKSFAFDLIERKIEYYLPFYIKVTKKSDGKFRKSTLVLFPSYVPFISDEPYSLFKTNRVATILKIESQNRFKTQLNQIWVTINNDVSARPVDCNVQIGDFVKIMTGALKDVTGQVLKIQGYASLLLRVDGMGCVTINIDASQIKRVNVNE